MSTWLLQQSQTKEMNGWGTEHVNDEQMQVILYQMTPGTTWTLTIQQLNNAFCLKVIIKTTIKIKLRFFLKCGRTQHLVVGVFIDAFFSSSKKKTINILP